MSLNSNLGNFVTYSQLVDITGQNTVADIFIVDPARGPFLVTDFAFCLTSFTTMTSVTVTLGIRTVGTSTVANTILPQFAITAQWDTVGQWQYIPYSTTSYNLPVSIPAGSTVSFKNTTASNTGVAIRITVIIQGYYLN